LRVTANDVRTWTVFYRDQHARQKRLSLGRYPAVKLVDGRELAREAHRKVAHGGDPVVEKRAAREVTTFGTLAKEYIDGRAKPNKRSWEEDPFASWSEPASGPNGEFLASMSNGKS